MNSLVVEITNYCNFSCKHCSRDKIASRVHMPLEMFKNIIEQAVSLGIHDICITGGEPLTYPWLDTAIDIATSNNIEISIVTNGFLFKEKLLSIIRKHRNLDICFSLDGANEKQHDFFRNKTGSFKAVIEAIKLCNKCGVNVSVKMSIWSGVKDSLFEMATFALSQVNNASFIVLTPTPNLVKHDLIPSPEEYERVINIIKREIIPVFNNIDIEGVCDRMSPVPLCNPFYSGVNIDYKGDIVFCCNLSNVSADNKDKSFYIGNIKEMDLDNAFVKHIKLCSSFIKKMAKKPFSLWERSCFFCMFGFGLMEWLKSYDSPWRNLLWKNLI